MIVTEAVRKFNQFARQFLFMVSNKEEIVGRMLEIFHPKLVVVIDSVDNLPTVVECVGQPLRVEYCEYCQASRPELQDNCNQMGQNNKRKGNL